MLVNNDINRGGVAGFDSRSVMGQGESALGWKELKPSSRRAKGQGRRRIFAITSIILLIAIVFSVVRVASVAAGTNDQLTLTVGSQQSALIDLRQSVSISPDLYGVNVFPEVGTNSIEANYTGFMNYGPEVTKGLRDAGINLLRFPGGSWNEKHILSYDQLYDFSQLLYTTGAQGMIQARISDPIDKYTRNSTVEDRAKLAGHWVDFMSNPTSTFRKDFLSANHLAANTPIHSVMFWSVGNEPDQLINPETGKIYTVADYVKTFIAFSLQMHQNNPTIKVFGPELSQFYGVGVGPTDSTGLLWMEGFLRGVADYEKANPHLPYHLLDGVSFHSYQFLDAKTSPNLLMSSSEEWNYLLPQLHQLIRQIMTPAVGPANADLPIAITEINSNPSSGFSPTAGQAALWWADTLGTLMNDQADYVSYFSAQGVDSPYPLFTQDTTPQPTAMYRVFQMFTHLQSNLVPLQVQHDPVDVFATTDSARQTVSLMFVNKSADNQTAQISPLNTAFGFSPWQTQNVSIAGYSIVLITLHRGGGTAVAYSFQVPISSADTLKPVQSFVCGSKTDPLAFTTPC
jgi:hypothetical protein